MADLGHLEKMGRELKCPICLSLLKSAVSLACNHVFCNSCIKESMKSVSDCPVCKVPFRRREVRPAPHMDNLVNVFKSMEVAAGVNIFTTQVAPSTKHSDAPKLDVEHAESFRGCSDAPVHNLLLDDALTLGDGEKNSGTPKTIAAHRGRSKGKELTYKTRQKLEKAEVMTSDQCPPTKPSFPAKKRIHVTPYPVSETPVRPEKVSKSGNLNIEFEDNKALDENKRVAMEEQEDSLFSPFFWLREQNDDDEASEKLSAHLTADTSQPSNAPCFSDIKDSEDVNSPIKMTPTSKSNVVEAFDSEMFEWTQRACSPELCSTPLRKQSAGRNKLDAIQEKDCQEISQTGMVTSNEVSRSNCVKGSKTGQSNENIENSRTVLSKEGTLKKKKRSDTRTQGKHSKTGIRTTSGKFLDEVHPEVLVDSTEIAKGSSQENEDREQMEPLSRGREGSKRGKKPANHYHKKNDAAIIEASKQPPTISTKANIQNQEKDDTCEVLPVFTCSEAKNDLTLDVQNKASKRGKVTFQSKRKRMKISMDESKTLVDVLANTLNEAKVQNLEYQKAIISRQILSSKQSDNAEGSGNGSPKSSQVIQKKKVGESKEKRRKNQTADVAMDNNVNKVPLASVETAGCTNNQTCINLPESDSWATKSLSRTKEFLTNNGDKIMRKCGNLHSQIRCDFCQSSNDTEDSGEMMHYFNGKPVAADYNGGANVIHSHKHCTEWAPDVYFEDDLAINLSAELARSRRIKCSCCGIKGAALGCYEKSCRKSFHFTCAKLIPECRWDDENFVMLCPLHSSSKLPNEASKTQRQRRKRSTPKEEMQAPSICKTSHDTSRKWTWPSGSPCKWFLCCSALTASEKDIISEFTRLTGASISKTWSPAVTHVVASIDENGACRRTLKFLMGILDGKWIVSMEWIKACLKAMEPVDEEKFEITVDVQGISEGPRLGRLRAINKEPKLFSGFIFYFTGDFMPSYKGYLQDLVIAAGGAVLQRKLISRDQEMLLDDSSKWPAFIIYSLELPEKHKCRRDAIVIGRRRAEAQALADACGAKVAANSWIIDSIAASKLQPQLDAC